MYNYHYIHFKDTNKVLVASVAYQINAEGKIAYGATVVSPSEPRNNISYRTARIRSRARAAEAIKSTFNRETIPWKNYASRTHVVDTHGNDSPFRALKDAGLCKIGIVEIEQFKKLIQRTRELIYKYTKK